MMLSLSLWAQCAPAAAAVSCDQLGNIAYATEQFRNQGDSLETIMKAANDLESANNLGKDDMVRIRQTVQQVFDRTQTPLEVRKDCKDPPPKRP